MVHVGTWLYHIHFFQTSVTNPALKVGLVGGLLPWSHLDQFFVCDLVVLESISYRTRAKRLINDSKTTGGLRKILTGFKRPATQRKVLKVMAHRK